MLPGVLLSYLAGGSLSGGWGIFTILVFAGAAKALGLQKKMSLLRLPLHRGYTFVRTTLAFGFIFFMLAAVPLLLLEQWEINEQETRSLGFALFAVLSLWPLSRLWPAPALPFVIEEDEGSRDIITQLWVGPGIPNAFELTALPFRFDGGLVMLLIHLNIAIFVFGIPPGGEKLPPDVARFMCFSLMPLTVYLWVQAAAGLHRAEATASPAARMPLHEHWMRKLRGVFGLSGGSSLFFAPAGSQYDGSLPLDIVGPAMVIHALRDHRAPTEGAPAGRWMIRDRHETEHEGVMAALGEGTRTPCLVLRVVDMKAGRRPNLVQELEQWEAEVGDRLLLLHTPIPHARSCFCVIGVAENAAKYDPEAGRDAFNVAGGTVMLVDLLAMVSSETGSPDRVRYDDGRLIRMPKKSR